MKTINNYLFRCVTLLLVITWACDGNPKKLNESPTRGNIKIAADESFKPLIDAEIYTFQSLYTNAFINSSYKPENDVIADLLNDSVRVIVVSRELSAAESDRLKAKQIIARTTKIAHDAVCFILNKENTDSTLRYDQIQGIIDGSITSWKQINATSKLGDIVVVFDSDKSGNFRFIQEKFLMNKPLPKQLYALNTNPEVLEYVKGKANAIGVIGANWISDKDDTTSNKFLSGIRIAAIGEPGNTAGGVFRKPFQGYIAESSYPFTRNVYTISRESFVGLGTGFVQFVAGDIGQRIVLKSGLVPATMPIRLVTIKK